MLWKIETFIEGDTKYKKHCTKDNNTSVPFKVGTLGPHTILPIAISCTIVFSWISSRVCNFFPFKGDFSFGKSQKSQGTKSGVLVGLSHLGDLIFCQKLCRRCDAHVGALSWWSCQSPFAHSCSLLNPLNSFHGGPFKLNAKLDADSLLYSFSHFKWDSHTVQMLIQPHLPPPLTSTVESSLFTHAHSSPLSVTARLHQRHANHSGYINNGWAFSGQTLYIMFFPTHTYLW